MLRQKAKKLAKHGQAKSVDPEAMDWGDGTLAKGRARVGSDSDASEDDEVFQQRGQLRTQFGLSEELEQGAYKGAVVRRQDLDGAAGSEGEGEEEEEEEDEEVGSEGSEGEESSEASGSASESGSEDNEDADADDGDDDVEDTLAQLAQEDAVSALRLTKEKTNPEQADHVRHQQELWDAGVEFRILQQRAVVLGNRLPIGPIASDFAASSPPIAAAYAALTASLSSTLSALISLRAETIARTPDVAKAFGQDVSTAQGPEGVAVAAAVVQERGGLLPASGSSAEAWRAVDAQWNAYAGFRDATINKWARKTKFSGGDASAKRLKVLDQDLTSQIEAVLVQPERALQRTRARKGAVSVFGRGSADPDPSSQYDTDVFDDTEFYHQLLQSFVDASGEPGAGATIARKPKTKKDVIRGASKGRQLRFHVHPKLVNFCEPTPYPDAGVDVDVLLKSIFTR